MKKRFVFLSLIGVLMLLLTPPAHAQDMQTLQNPLAYVSGDGNIYLADLNTRLSVPVTDDSAREYFQTSPFFRTTRAYGQISWSTAPALIFVDQVTRNIYAARSRARPQRIGTTTADHGYPPAVQGDQVAWVVSGDGLTRRIQAADLSGGNGRDIGQFSETRACPAPITVDPAEALYWDETGPNGATALFAWLPDKFIRFSSCDNAIIATRADGSVLWRTDNILRVSLSPRRSQIAAVRRDPTSLQTALVIIDSATGTMRDLQPQIGLDQVAWWGDSVLYSTRVDAPVDPANPMSEAGQRVFPGVWPLNYRHYALTLWAIPATGGTPQRLFDGAGYGIGSLAAVPDGSGVAFTVVGSSLGVVQRINAEATAADIAAAAPTVELWYKSAITGTQPVQIVSGGQLAYGGGSYTAALGAQGPGALDPAAMLIIGRPALVTVTSAETLNLRNAPGFAAPIIRPLKAAEVVDITGGPQFADGGRWWPIRTFDRLTGWALERTQTYGRPVINLRPLATGIVITFSADKRLILPGECVTMTWRVEGALSATLNGRDVPFTGRESTCPAQNTPFVMVALGRDGAWATGFMVNINAGARG